MNISAIETFLAIVRTGNLNRASERLNVTQSTVTARLDVLEQALGQRLLIRSRKGATLTKAGYAFLGHAELMVETWRHAQSKAGLPKGFSGIFSLACHFDLWHDLGEVWVAEKRTELSDLAFETWPGEDGRVGSWLQSGLIDAALLMQPVTGPGISSHIFTEERLVQVSDHQRRVKSWDPAYIYVDNGQDFRRQHAEAWPEDNTAYMTVGSADWGVKHLLNEGGSAYLPWRMVRRYIEAGRLYLIDGAPEFQRKCYISWRQQSLIDFPWLGQQWHFPEKPLE